MLFFFARVVLARELQRTLGDVDVPDLRRSAHLGGEAQRAGVREKVEHPLALELLQRNPFAQAAQIEKRSALLPFPDLDGDLELALAYFDWSGLFSAQH